MSRSVRVDAHHHVWDLAVRDQPWTAQLPILRQSFSLLDLEPVLRAQRVDATVVVQTIMVAAETPELLALAGRGSFVAGVVGWTDLCAPDVDANLAALQSLPGGDRLVAIRHQVQEEVDPRWLCRPAVLHGLRQVAQAGLAYDLVVTPHQLPAVVDVTRAVPDLRFVLDHAGKPAIRRAATEPWATQLRTLAGSENVAVKLSGLVTEADHQAWSVDQLRPFADVVLSAFGPDRVMFGSDWPVCLLAASYDEVIAAATHLTAGLSPTEMDAVFGTTATRWYGLRVP